MGFLVEVRKDLFVVSVLCGKITTFDLLFAHVPADSRLDRLVCRFVFGRGDAARTRALWDVPIDDG